MILYIRYKDTNERRCKNKEKSVIWDVYGSFEIIGNVTI